MSGYDRIHVPDRVKLSDLDDDPQLDEWGVRIKPQQESSLKRVCSSLRRRPLALLIGVGCVVLILFITIIATLAHSRKSGFEGFEYPDRDIGLFFDPRPEDGSVRIHYSPLNDASYRPYVDRLNFVLHDYNPVYQQDPDDGFVDCTAQYKPANKKCRYSLEKFGQHQCSYLNVYGFKEGMPCIFLSLKLPDGAKPRAMQEGDPDYQKARLALGDSYSTDHIGVTCNGTTEADQRHIGHQREPMLYFPPEGFVSFLFPNGNIPPMVAVKFGAVADLNDVSITCRAWLGALGENVVQDPNLFSITFIISKSGE